MHESPYMSCAIFQRHVGALIFTVKEKKTGLETPSINFVEDKKKDNEKEQDKEDPVATSAFNGTERSKPN